VRFYSLNIIAGFFGFVKGASEKYFPILPGLLP